MGRANQRSAQSESVASARQIRVVLVNGSRYRRRCQTIAWQTRLTSPPRLDPRGRCAAVESALLFHEKWRRHRNDPAIDAAQTTTNNMSVTIIRGAVFGSGM